MLTETQLKNFCQEAAKLLYVEAAGKNDLSGEAILAKLPQYKDKALTVLFDEAHYGTIKFCYTPPPSVATPLPTQTIIRLKRADAYDGPKTEHYLEKARSMIKAAQSVIVKSDRQEKMQALSKLRLQIQHDLLTFASISPEEMGDLSRENNQAEKHFNESHDNALFLLQNLNKEIEKILDKVGDPNVKGLFALEAAESASQKKPKLMTVRQVTPETIGKQDKYIVINVSVPVNSERTGSSAKKDEHGIVNWFDSSTEVMDLAGNQVIAPKSSWRSASLVPHDILNTRKSKTFGVNKESIDIAQTITAFNVKQELIPKLCAQKQKESPKDCEGWGKDEQHPMILDFMMQTLITPIAAHADVVADPDYHQVLAIKKALDKYDGRPIEIPNPQNPYKTLWVQFNVGYVNYAVNRFRGVIQPTLEREINDKGYNVIIERSQKALQKNFEGLSTDAKRKVSTLNDLMQNQELPRRVLRLSVAIEKTKAELNKAYFKLDHAEKADLSLDDHKTYTALYVKKYKAKKTLTKNEKKQYDDFREKQATNKDNKLLLEKKINARQETFYRQHGKLAEHTKKYYKANKAKIENQLAKLEKDEHKTTDSMLKTYCQHARTLFEYHALVLSPYDCYHKKYYLIPERSFGENEQNYQLQVYQKKLSDYAGVRSHKTCKGGKDRTNTLEEKEQAHELATEILDRVPKLQDEKRVKALRDQLFEEGYQHGVGNYICGLNIAPSAQQVDADDIDTKIQIQFWKKIASLQKNSYKKEAFSIIKQIKEKSRGWWYKPNALDNMIQDKTLGTDKMSPHPLNEVLNALFLLQGTPDALDNPEIEQMFLLADSVYVTKDVRLQTNLFERLEKLDLTLFKRTNPVLVKMLQEATQKGMGAEETIGYTHKALLLLTEQEAIHHCEALKAHFNVTLNPAQKGTVPLNVDFSQEGDVCRADKTLFETKITMPTKSLDQSQQDEVVSALVSLALEEYKCTGNKVLGIIAPHEDLAIKLYAAARQVGFMPNLKGSKFSPAEKRQVTTQANTKVPIVGKLPNLEGKAKAKKVREYIPHFAARKVSSKKAEKTKTTNTTLFGALKRKIGWSP